MRGRGNQARTLFCTITTGTTPRTERAETTSSSHTKARPIVDVQQPVLVGAAERRGVRPGVRPGARRSEQQPCEPRRNGW